MCVDPTSLIAIEVITLIFHPAWDQVACVEALRVLSIPSAPQYVWQSNPSDKPSLIVYPTAS